MEKRVTPPKRVTSPTWGPPSPCKQALIFLYVLFENIGEHASEANARERKIKNVYFLLLPSLPPCAGGQ